MPHELGFSLHHLGWTDPTTVAFGIAAAALILASVIWEPTKN